MVGCRNEIVSSWIDKGHAQGRAQAAQPTLRLVSSIRGIGPTSHPGWDVRARPRPAVEEKRQSIRSSVLGTGTLACPGCDAPIAPGARPLLLTDPIACPFCDERGVVRDFLSLTAPTRPARVVIRVLQQAR